MFYYEAFDTNKKGTFGTIYTCDHPVYNSCTLYLFSGKGLSVIQQRYDPATKKTWWSEIDEWLVDELFLTKGFKLYFYQHAGRIQNGLYPTVTLRQLMHGIKVRPLKKEPWETVFDKTDF